MSKKKIRGLLFVFIPLFLVSGFVILMGCWKVVAIVWGMALTVTSIGHGIDILLNIKHGL